MGPLLGSGVFALLRQERDLEADLALLVELQSSRDLEALVLLARDLDVLARDLEALALLALLLEAERERDLSVLFI